MAYWPFLTVTKRVDAGIELIVWLVVAPVYFAKMLRDIIAPREREPREARPRASRPTVPRPAGPVESYQSATTPEMVHGKKWAGRREYDAGSEKAKAEMLCHLISRGMIAKPDTGLLPLDVWVVLVSVATRSPSGIIREATRLMGEGKSAEETIDMLSDVPPSLLRAVRKMLKPPAPGHSSPEPPGRG